MSTTRSRMSSVLNGRHVVDGHLYAKIDNDAIHVRLSAAMIKAPRSVLARAKNDGGVIHVQPRAIRPLGTVKCTRVQNWSPRDPCAPGVQNDDDAMRNAAACKINPHAIHDDVGANSITTRSKTTPTARTTSRQP